MEGAISIVQRARTYSPRYSWPAITTNSGFMRASCSPQSQLRRFLVGLAPPYGLATHCKTPLYHVCSPRYKGHADLTSSPPSSSAKRRQSCMNIQHTAGVALVTALKPTPHGTSWRQPCNTCASSLAGRSPFGSLPLACQTRVRFFV